LYSSVSFLEEEEENRLSITGIMRAKGSCFAKNRVSGGIEGIEGIEGRGGREGREGWEEKVLILLQQQHEVGMLERCGQEKQEEDEAQTRSPRRE